MKRSARVGGSATPSPQAESLSPLHPLLLPVEEACHQLSEKGQERVDADPELAPGHDCCAVCAGSCELVCTACHSVRYCSAQHLTDDAPLHSLACPTLRCMRAAAAAGDEPNEPTQQQDPGQAAAPSARPESAGASDSNVKQPGTGEAFRPPPRGGQHGWPYVAPDCFAGTLYAVRPAQEAGPDAGEEEEPARKRARPANLMPDREPAAGDGADVAAEGPAAGEDALLGLAAQLAERTATLTYAFTAAFALGASAAASASAAAAAAAGRPLSLVVLGAAADAELAEPASWQVVADCVGTDVRILFVGPEVPDSLDGREEQHGRVVMRFVQSTYDGLLAGCSGGGAESLPGATPGPDVYLAFNPGLTCPDYDWSHTLAALTRAAVAARAEAPSRGAAAAASPELRQHGRAQPCLVLATNTRLEALMEAEELWELGWRPEAPPAWNPYTSLLTLQSGTLANDLYRKNAVWGCYTYGPQVELRGARRHGWERKLVQGVAGALFRAVVAPIARLLKRR